MTHLRCPVCGSRQVRSFLQRSQVPVHQNLVVSSAAQARAVTRGELHMVVCGDCGFVFNQAFDLSRLAYGKDYDNTQSCSGHFDTYLDGLVKDLVERQGVRRNTIVEVGCGKGHFLRKLVAFPGAGNSGFGFDPSYVRARIRSGRGAQVSPLLLRRYLHRRGSRCGSLPPRD